MRKQGFTLVEIAIVLFIVSIIISIGILSFSHLMEGEKYKLAREMLEKNAQTLTGKILSQGRLPCPDINCDGQEDLCTDPSGCDFDGNSTKETPYGHCASESVEKGLLTLSPNYQCKTTDFQTSPPQVPPYLLPYLTVGTAQSDPFSRLIRYDVNPLLSRADMNVNKICKISIWASSNKQLEVEPYLPIVTTDLDTNDDNSIAFVSNVPQGYSVAAVLISEGGCIGVSGKNKGANKEYETIDKKVTDTGECTGYDDVVRVINYEDIVANVCSFVNLNRNFYITIADASNKSIGIYDLSTSSEKCLNLNYPSNTAFSFGVDIFDDSDYIKIYNSPDCSTDGYRIIDFISEDGDGDGFVVLNTSGNIEDSKGFVLFLTNNTCVISDTDNDGTADTNLDYISGAINTVFSYFNGGASSVGFFSNPTCSGSPSSNLQLAYSNVDAVNGNLNDRRVIVDTSGNPVELIDNTSSVWKHKKLHLIIDPSSGDLSYRLYPSFQCKNFSSGSGGIQIDVDIRRFGIFYISANCSSSNHLIDAFTLNDILYMDANEDNDGCVKIDATGIIAGGSGDGC